jgi:electron transfer flavoprotein beta subunit
VRILVCVKRVPITGGKMVLTADEQALETRHLGFTISPHEECGVEEAVRLVEASSAAGAGGETVVLTLGPAEAEEQLRDCMAVGADRGILLKTDGADWDAQSTAGAIVDAIRVLQQEGEPFDLILFGNESADTGNYQVGIRVAHALGLPVVNGLKKIELEGANVRCERDAGGARDVYVVPVPAVLSVLEGLNLPRYPSVPGRLRAKSKPLAVVELERPAQRLEKLRLVVPPGQGKQAEILGSGPEAAPRVVELMQQLGVA